MTMCVRPVLTGGSMVWSRTARDEDRALDTVRCLCGGPYCRDTELKEDS